MAQISAGTVAVQTASVYVNKVPGGPSWATVKAGHLFIRQDDDVPYKIIQFVPAAGASPDTLVLAAPYQGATSGSCTYVIVQDFTVGSHIPKMNRGDLKTGVIFNEAMRIMDSLNHGGTGSGTADMSKAVYDQDNDEVVDGVAGPVILGWPNKIPGQFPAAIAVPAFANHIDQAWAMGQYDDHFDGGTLASKWAQVVASTGSIRVRQSSVNLSQQSPTPGALSTNIEQVMPVGITLNIKWKMKFHLNTNYLSNNTSASEVNMWLFNRATNGTVPASFRVRFLHQLVINQGLEPRYNACRMLIYYGAGGGTISIVDTVTVGMIPEYYNIVFDVSTRTTLLYASFDGASWVPYYTSIAGTQTGFGNIALPNAFQFSAGSAGQSNTHLSIDWFSVNTK